MRFGSLAWVLTLGSLAACSAPSEGVLPAAPVSKQNADRRSPSPAEERAPEANPDRTVGAVPEELTALDERLSTQPFDLEGQRARFVGFVELGRYHEAFKRLHAYLYLQAQRDELPPESTWLALLETHFDPRARAAEGTKFLSLLDDFYTRSPVIDGHLLDYVLVEGRHDVAIELLEGYVRKYPNDPKWRERLDALEE